jgi:hypothetical protein
VYLSKLHLNLNLRQNVSHADEMKYAGVKIRDLEKQVLDHEWQERQAAVHYGHSIVVYIVVGLFSLYIVIRLVLCMKARGVCQRVAGVLGANSRVAAAPD